MKSRSTTPKGQTLVIVESPTKAKTIRKFLDKGYVVESCFGHIRDLPKSSKDIPEKFKKQKWATLGVNVDKGFEPIYCIPKDKNKIVKNLKSLLEDSTELILATDEDREGESISWHLVEVLNPKIPTKRMVFHEITKTAIQKALGEVRDIDYNLVRAQEARRVLDRLVGYTLSPLIWKKVAYGLSAGRVQSVAVKLICEREKDRIRFVKSEYWDLDAQLEKSNISFSAKITNVDGKKVASGKDFDPETGRLKSKDQFVLLNRDQAEAIQSELQGQKLKVTSVDERPVSRKPSAPFITSTLQQEANRKLGLSARETMQVAQKLYEQGFITYMRTDSTFLSQQALEAARKWILKEYGSAYLPQSPRLYHQNKSKGAQEAHEAIRPAGDSFVAPGDSGLSGLQLKLYDLIWKRAVASQMVDARQKQVVAKLAHGKFEFQANGMSIEFPGFLRAYVEGSDDPDQDLSEREVVLPQLAVGEDLKPRGIKVHEHETKPPARYTEASLVQRLEKEGVGRPSTYASIISTVQDRGYVKKVGNALAPTFTAMIVSKLLEQHLPEYVDTGFTSVMESSLDSIADGELDSQKYLKEIYFGEKGLLKRVESQEKLISPEEARSIQLDGLKSLQFRVGRYGAYVCTDIDGKEVCASIPESETPADMTESSALQLIEQKIKGADALGVDPSTQEPVYLLTGRYGPYVQLGATEGEREAGEKIKRASLPPNWKVEDIDIKKALFLLSLPKDLGEHPDLKKPVKLGLGRFGPYVVCDGDYRSIPKGVDFAAVNFQDALQWLKEPKKSGRGRGKKEPLKALGLHSKTGESVDIFEGPYGVYIKSGKLNVSIPEGITVDQVTLAQAESWILEKHGDSAAPKKKAPQRAKKAKRASASPTAEMKKMGTKVVLRRKKRA